MLLVEIAMFSLPGFLLTHLAHTWLPSANWRVYDPSKNNPWKLLEIKCPTTDSISQLKYLRCVNGVYKVKKTFTRIYPCIHRIHKWPLRGAAWIRKHGNWVGKALAKSITKKSWRRPALCWQKATLFSLRTTYLVLPWLGEILHP